MRIRLKALAPLLGIVGSYLVSPAALAIVPAQYAWILALVSGLIAVVTPALVTDRPKTPKRIPKKGIGPSDELAGTGAGDPFAPFDADAERIAAMRRQWSPEPPETK